MKKYERKIDCANFFICASNIKTMNSLNFKVPANFTDSSYLDRLAELNRHHEIHGTKIVETYGSLPQSYIGNARTSAHLPAISINDVKQYVIKSKGVGIDFNYVINSSWSNGLEFTSSGKEKILKELNMLQELGIIYITVCSPEIFQIVKKYFPDFKICLSTNLYISSLHELQRWEIEGVDTVIIDCHVNRDFDLLRTLCKSPIRLELLINSMCNLNCSLRYYHNLVNCAQSNVMSERWNTYFPQSLCTKYNLSNPLETLCSAWIRPEDLDFYNKEFGINHFKIDGRSLEIDHLIEIVNSYVNKKHEGNFFDLFDFFNTRRKTGVSFFLDNRKLDGFLQQTMYTPCRLCGGHNSYCQSLANQIEVLNKSTAKVYQKMLYQTIRNEF